MIDFQTMETALKIAWVNRIRQNCHSSWKILIEHFFRQYGGFSFLLNCRYDLLGPGRTRGQNCFCCDKIIDKYLYPVNLLLLCLGSHAICIPVIHASKCVNAELSRSH